MEKAKKDERLIEIKELVVSFCVEYLKDELQSYALKLCDTLNRKRKISITSGKKEIWAASIIYVIARLNFLFEPRNRPLGTKQLKLKKPVTLELELKVFAALRFQMH